MFGTMMNTKLGFVHLVNSSLWLRGILPNALCRSIALQEDTMSPISYLDGVADLQPIISVFAIIGLLHRFIPVQFLQHLQRTKSF